MSAHDGLRIAVRKLDAFEQAIEKQWGEFCKFEKADFNLEIVPFDIPDLHAALFEKEGLRRGDFDVAFVVTDWIAQAVAGQQPGRSTILLEGIASRKLSRWMG